MARGKLNGSHIQVRIFASHPWTMLSSLPERCMSNASIQGGSDGKHYQPQTQEKRTPFRTNTLNQYSSHYGSYRLSSLYHQLYNAARAATHGIRCCNQPIGIQRDGIDWANKLLCRRHHAHYKYIGCKRVEREHQGLKPEQ